MSNTFVTSSVVAIEDQAYMTNLLAAEWQPVSREILPFNFPNLGQS